MSSAWTGYIKAGFLHRQCLETEKQMENVLYLGNLEQNNELAFVRKVLLPLMTKHTYVVLIPYTTIAKLRLANSKEVKDTDEP